MIHHRDIEPKALRRLIRNGSVVLAGNRRLNIYGKLSCKSGKRMHIKHRVLFLSMQEAIQNGFRPCAHCMKQAYIKWKEQFSISNDQTYGGV